MKRMPEHRLFWGEMPEEEGVIVVEQLENEVVAL
jgi:hypothetical protein